MIIATTSVIDGGGSTAVDEIGVVYFVKWKMKTKLLFVYEQTLSITVRLCCIKFFVQYYYCIILVWR